MNSIVKKEVKIIIKRKSLNCSVEKFQDKINWNWICRFQKISEDFIREFQYKVNWNSISYFQKLSEDFICEFQEKLDIEWLIENNKIAKERLLELREINSIHSRFEILDIR